MTCAVVNVVVR